MPRILNYQMKHIYLLSVLCLLGCGKPAQKGLKVEPIHLETSDIHDFIGMPLQLVTLDSVLFINDFFGDTLVHGISLKDNTLTTKLGIKGNGPNEVLPPLHLFKKKDSLFVFSRPKWTLYGMGLKDGGIRKKFTTPMDVGLLFPLQDGFYLASGAFKDKRFWILDASGAKVAEFGEYPLFWEKEADIPLEVRGMFHQVCGYAYSETKGIAVASSHVLSFYAKSPQGEYTLRKEVLLANYEFNFMSGNTLAAPLKPSYMKGTKNLVATDDYIYILFNVNSEESPKRLNNEIWKLDWEGNFICKYKPDVDISLFTLNAAHDIIGLTKTEDPQMVVWHE